jgi:hypothetical protein
MYETYFARLTEGVHPGWRLSNGSNKTNIILPSGGMNRRF